MKVGWHVDRVAPRDATPSSTATLRRRYEGHPSRTAAQTFRRTCPKITRMVSPSFRDCRARSRIPAAIAEARDSHNRNGEVRFPPHRLAPRLIHFLKHHLPSVLEVRSRIQPQFLFTFDRLARALALVDWDASSPFDPWSVGSPGTRVLYHISVSLRIIVR